MALLPHHQNTHTISPFLNVFKEGHLVESFCLDSRDFFVLGRHTNCDVQLAHPSISRHHLEVQLLHATREILLTDMDSVHGTWIDGKQIPPLSPCAVKEGVAIKLGASSRTYKVQWLHHPMPSSSNEKSITPEAVDSNLSNTGTMLSLVACSSKSSNPCMESSQDVCPLQPARTSDARSNNGKTGCDVQLPDRDSSRRKQEEKSPQLSMEVSLAGHSANGLDVHNAHILLQTSQQQQQKEGLPPLPPASSRRTPFAPLPQNAQSPSIKRNAKCVEKKLIHGDNTYKEKLTKEGEENVLTGSRLWLRRCNSAPSPVLNVSASVPQQLAVPHDQPSSTLRNNRLEKVAHPNKNFLAMKPVQKGHEERSQMSNIMRSIRQTLEEENAPELPNKATSEGVDQQDADQHLTCHSFDEAAIDEEYPSDKENQEPAFYMGKHCKGGKITPGPIGINRKPFQPLFIMPHGVSRPASPCSSYVSGRDDESSLARDRSRPSSVVQNLDYMLQKLKGMARLEPHHEWHMVVDITCLLDPKSFKSLILLEGIKEVRIIIPQIVIRELDFSNRKDKTHMSPTTVLKWIEACMLKHPSWIHVQNSSESLPVGASTPPASPHHGPSACAGAFGDLMSPTNGDHVLNCALVFSTTIFDGQVALLTSDTALKIKAMAEGIVCDGATSFCESLLSPYSERFLWAGSVAHHGPQWTERSCHSTVLESSIAEPNRRASFMSAARGMTSKKHQVVENLKNHCKQAQGLKAILS